MRELVGKRQVMSVVLALLAVAFASFIAAIPAPAFAAGPHGEPASAYLMATGSEDLALEEGAKPASPTVEEKLSKLNLKVRAKVAGKGWTPSVKSGRTAGKKAGKGLQALRMRLTGTSGVKGSIRYRVYVPGKGWSKTVGDGKVARLGSKRISAVRVWLTGKVAKYYDVYYHVFIRGYGWLDWASAKQIAGTTNLSHKFTAIQVKLVKKGGKAPGAMTTYRLKDAWQALEFKYRDDADVEHLLEVRYKGNSRANILLREKAGKKRNKWKTVVSCAGYTGGAGIGQASAYSTRTPSGDFEITSAFGIKSDPGSILEYVKVTPSMYWCADRSHYNELIDINEHPHACTGEHLIDYSPHYDYGLFFDYNTNPVRYGAGSAFFVHCTDYRPTGGCVGVPKSQMIDIVRRVTPHARLLIYWE